MRPTAFALAALLASVSFSVIAQEASAPAADMVAVSPAVQTFATQLAAAAPEARAAMIRTFLANNPGTGLSLVQAVQASNPDLAKSVFDAVVAILGESDANAAEVEALTNAFPQLLASGDAEIEPAAGDAPDAPSFEAVGAEGGETVVEQENPNQLSNGNAVSPN
jgi:hypothetical protein